MESNLLSKNTYVKGFFRQGTIINLQRDIVNR